MASKTKQVDALGNDITPDWVTQVKSIYNGGLAVGIDNATWLWRSVPLDPVDTAVSVEHAMRVGGPIMRAFQELESMTRLAMPRRSVARSQYREFHMLLVNIPQRYVPDTHQSPEMQEFLSQMWPQRRTMRRVLLFGVRLTPSMRGRTMKDTMTNFAQMFQPQDINVNLTEYEEDRKRVSSLLDRVGMREPTSEEMRLCDSWWNEGRNPDVPYLVHADHLHMFSSTASMDEAARLDRAEIGCLEPEWAELEHHHTLSMSAFEGFKFEFRDAGSSEARFVSEMLRRGARAVSFRGWIEPTSVTRNQLRQGRRKYGEDLDERAKSGQSSRAEQEEKHAALKAMEDAYAGTSGPFPTAYKCSIIAAVSGYNVRLGTYGMSEANTITMSQMVERQEKALAEMMMCSRYRANPLLRDLPAAALAYTGAPSLAKVGDISGALLGMTENDSQPAYINPSSASATDSLPIMLIAGGTGSGKLAYCNTPVPTPQGWSTVGQLMVGDEVFVRNGEVTRVSYLSPIKNKPDMYRVWTDDGQYLDVDYEHQYVVSSFEDRRCNRRDKHMTAIEAWKDRQAFAARVAEFAETYRDDVTPRAVDDLAELLTEQFGEDIPWSGPDSVRAALVMADVPFTVGIRPSRVDYAGDVRKMDPVKVWPVRRVLEAALTVWENTTGTNAARWRDQIESRKAAARDILLGENLGDETSREIARMLIERGAKGAVTSLYASLVKYARAAGITPVDAMREVILPMAGTTQTRHRAVNHYATNVALQGLARRLGEQLHNAPAEGYMEQRMTVGEMLGAGIRLGQRSNFAIRVPDSLQLPEAELPVDPYVLGAWLGDGSTSSGHFTSGDVDSCRSADGTSDQERLIARLVTAGYGAYRSRFSNKSVNVPGLMGDLRAAGVLGDKHIPMTYQRASDAQRLAVLQGLMDTDGTIDVKGACELSLSHERLASDALNLIRSLGIKASMSTGPAGYRDADGEYVVCKDRYRIHFTTDRPVFTLPRKVERLPESVRETQRWLYITRVEKIDPVPARCISVEHPDHTYLLNSFVPQSNTQVLLFLAAQFDQMGSPQVIVDPKRNSDHKRVVLARGGQVVRLDDMLESDGAFDPLRFAQDPQAGLLSALQVLLYLDPWGNDNPRRWETPLTVALRYGVENGATCIGQALIMARDAGRAPDEMVQPVLDARDANSLMSAIVGRDPKTKGLSVSDGMTLIMAGNIDIPLPEPGKEADNMQERLGVSLVRMMVFGSAMALTGRKGVLHFDEAWVAFVGGEAEVIRLGRLARSQGVLPILYTQRVSDALGVRDFISRGIILSVPDEDEARAACKLFKVEATDELLSRIIAPERTSESGGAPNYNSLKAQWEYGPDGKRIRNLRGSVGYYKDLNGRVCPVVIDLPPWFLALSSTNTDDLENRDTGVSADEEAKSIEKLTSLGTAAASRKLAEKNAEREAALAASTGQMLESDLNGASRVDEGRVGDSAARDTSAESIVDSTFG